MELGLGGGVRIRNEIMKDLVVELNVIFLIDWFNFELLIVVVFDCSLMIIRVVIGFKWSSFIMFEL